MVWWCGVQRVECIVLLMNRLIVRSLPVSDRILFCSTHCLAGPVGLLALENSHELHPCLSIHSILVSFIDSTKNTNPKIDSYRSIRDQAAPALRFSVDDRQCSAGKDANN